MLCDNQGRDLSDLQLPPFSSWKAPLEIQLLCWVTLKTASLSGHLEEHQCILSESLS